ncbi:CBS domain-containing protein [Rhizobium sp. BK275]|uniref:CBS domain-containing protein n=1 Tax=unclassified Rhizobium TaxID=2613769 RepID=UPI00160E464C|nr:MULTISPECIES: CBS domain-containing protein [unclassified Rhizobium]MBB3393323.1 CBS domain-containing protein [Rhizobium sp. BK275]MBB3406102.1 CBS domain-containing protein [Rhizobium sp. BK316]
MQAKDIMTSNVVSISPEAGVRHAIAVMMQNNISGLPVVDDEGRICGILTEGDLLLRREIRLAPRATRNAEVTSDVDLDRYIRGNGWSVRDIMSRDVIVARPDSEVSDIAESLEVHRIKRIPIVDDGRLVGIVSRRDILALITDTPTFRLPREDDAILLAVQTRLKYDLGLTPQRIRVSVRNGQVTLEGNVETELQRRAVLALVENLGSGGCLDRLQLVADSDPEKRSQPA